MEVPTAAKFARGTSTIIGSRISYIGNSSSSIGGANNNNNNSSRSGNSTAVHENDRRRCRRHGNAVRRVVA